MLSEAEKQSLLPFSFSQPTVGIARWRPPNWKIGNA